MRKAILPGSHDPVNGPGSHNHGKTGAGLAFALQSNKTNPQHEGKGSAAVAEAASNLALSVSLGSAEHKRPATLTGQAISKLPPRSPATPGGLPSGERPVALRNDATTQRRKPALTQDWKAALTQVDPLTAEVATNFPLDNIGNFAALGLQSGFEADSDQETKAGTETLNIRLARAERWALKAVAEKALNGTDLGKRLYRCNRYRLGSEVELWHDPLRHSASFRKVETCHSVWMCPVCSAKISERRRLELVEGIQAHRAQGGTVLFWTLTFPHAKSDELATILDRFLRAIRWLTGHKSYRQEIRPQFGLVGYVRALEVTHGKRNGWHPHAHALLFLERELTEEQFGWLYAKLHDLWARACERMGLDAPRLGVGSNLKKATASTEEVVAEYLAKWGYQPSKVPHWTATHELTKATSKRGREGGRSPWDLLRASLVEDAPASLALFREYAEAFRGKAQLRWTPGLRAKLGLGVEVTDEEIAEAASEDDNALLCSFDWRTWRRIAWAGAQGAILDAAGSGELDAVLGVLEGLPEAPRTAPKYDPVPRVAGGKRRRGGMHDAV